MNLNLELCQRCSCLVEASARWKHEQVCGYDNSNPPCMTCGAIVFDWAKHQKFHEEHENVKALLDRLLGDINAHLEFMAEEAR